MPPSRNKRRRASQGASPTNTKVDNQARCLWSICTIRDPTKPDKRYSVEGDLLPEIEQKIKDIGGQLTSQSKSVLGSIPQRIALMGLVVLHIDPDTDERTFHLTDKGLAVVEEINDAMDPEEALEHEDGHASEADYDKGLRLCSGHLRKLRATLPNRRTLWDTQYVHASGQCQPAPDDSVTTESEQDLGELPEQYSGDGGITMSDGTLSLSLVHESVAGEQDHSMEEENSHQHEGHTPPATSADSRAETTRREQGDDEHEITGRESNGFVTPPSSPHRNPISIPLQTPVPLGRTGSIISEGYRTPPPDLNQPRQAIFPPGQGSRLPFETPALQRTNPNVYPTPGSNPRSTGPLQARSQVDPGTPCHSDAIGSSRAAPAPVNAPPVGRRGLGSQFVGIATDVCSIMMYNISGALGLSLTRQEVKEVDPEEFSGHVGDWAKKNTDEKERLRGEVLAQNEVISQRNATIESQNASLREKEVVIEGQQNLIRRQEDVIEDQNATIQAKDTQIAMVNRFVGLWTTAGPPS
ncbi:hypothetical protein BKA70DRAFT_475174 [Coprinopsis sp. MPI-PUGE-AT-0042]|nr:hypothetical protein BKA70DRAFT_475174 [Coprinopsis sp. MPI-PUGE-AT-0042]